MKKFFILFVTCISAFTFAMASNDTAKKTENPKEVKQVDERIFYTSKTINPKTVTVPYTITVPAPPLGTIINIGGPCNENMTNWSVQNGQLSITYTSPHDILCLQDPDIYYIETPTIYEGKIMKYIITIYAM